MSTPDLPQARRHLIAERLAGGASVVAADLAAEFGLSEDAIRRDLRALAAEGRCRRVYGGAVPIVAGDPPLAARLREAPDRKLALARAGAATVRPGELVFIDTGSANLALVEFLPEDAELTVATNAVDVAAAVLHRQDLRLLMLGGEIDRHFGGCVDAAAVEGLSRMRIDRSFLGVCALTPQGLMTTHFSEAMFKRTLIRQSRHCSSLVISGKVNGQAAHHIGPLSALHTVILEGDAEADMARQLKEAGVEVIRVGEAA